MQSSVELIVYSVAAAYSTLLRRQTHATQHMASSILIIFTALRKCQQRVVTKECENSALDASIQVKHSLGILWLRSWPSHLGEDGTDRFVVIYFWLGRTDKCGVSAQLPCRENMPTGSDHAYAIPTSDIGSAVLPSTK